jgi:hypothetical protein
MRVAVPLFHWIKRKKKFYFFVCKHVKGWVRQQARKILSIQADMLFPSLLRPHASYFLREKIRFARHGRKLLASSRL